MSAKLPARLLHLLRPQLRFSGPLRSFAAPPRFRRIRISASPTPLAPPCPPFSLNSPSLPPHFLLHDTPSPDTRPFPRPVSRFRAILPLEGRKGTWPFSLRSTFHLPPPHCLDGSYWLFVLLLLCFWVRLESHSVRIDRMELSEEPSLFYECGDRWNSALLLYELVERERRAHFCLSQRFAHIPALVLEERAF